MRSLTLTALALILPLAACQTETAETGPAAPAVVDPPAAPAVAEVPINLNTATEEEFATIPGVGERMIHEFEEYRPYVSIQQFRREIGKYVDADQVAAYEEYLFVPIDPNASDAETLQQLPGVGVDQAAELDAGRPYASSDAFLARYAEVVSGGDRDAAARYLAAE